MKNRNNDIDVGVEIFTEVAKELYLASDTVEYNARGKVVFESNYCKIVLMLLDSKYSALINNGGIGGVNGMTLNEIGYILGGISRERVRQIYSSLITSNVDQDGSVKWSRGKITGTTLTSKYPTIKAKLSFLRELETYAYNDNTYLAEEVVFKDRYVT